MRHLFILLLSMLTANGLHAQSVTRHLAQPSRHSQMVNGLLHLQQDQHAPAMKATATTKYRLKARSIRDNTLNTLIDSVDLAYGGFRTSTYDYNTMLFAFNYPYNTSPMFNYAGTFTKPQVLFDTLRRWQVNPNTLAYGYYQTDIATYDTGSKLTGYKALYVDSAFYPNTIHANTFTSAKNISMGISSNWVGGVADSAFKQYFTYDTGNRLIKDSTYEQHLGIWRIASKTLYTYDASKNLTVIETYANMTDTSFLLPLVKQLKYVNTYDASKRLLTVLDSTFNGTALEAYVKDTFAYTGAYTFHTSWKQHQYDPIDNTWNPQLYMSKHLNTINLPDTVNIRGWDSLANSWVHSAMYIVHYNSNNDPDTLKDYQYDFTAFPSTPDFTTKYYYQTFVDNTGLEDQRIIAKQPKVFPNPSVNSINITELDVPQNTMVGCSLLNAAGQMVRRESMPWTGKTTLSIADFTPGMYLLVIHNDQGNVIHQQSIIKQ